MDGEPSLRPGTPDWSVSGGPDVFTLRAWLGVERAAETVDGLDDAVHFMQDRVSAVFGQRAVLRFGEFVEDRGLGQDAVGRLLADDGLLRELLAFLLADDEAPDLPAEEYEWCAYPPGQGPPDRLRRAVRRRREAAALAFLLPRRGRDRVAGLRARPRRRSAGEPAGHGRI